MADKFAGFRVEAEGFVLFALLVFRVLGAGGAAVGGSSCGFVFFADSARAFDSGEGLIVFVSGAGIDWVCRKVSDDVSNFADDLAYHRNYRSGRCPTAS